MRSILQFNFAWDNDINSFSLRDVDMSTARNFISYLIEFCFYWEVPTKDTLLNQTDDIGKYLYSCLKYRRCAICNKKAEIHHVDRIGMGRNREHIVHVGLKAIALCPEHHDKAHHDEKTLFKMNYIYGIKLDEYLCKRLNLRTKERG